MDQYGILFFRRIPEVFGSGGKIYHNVTGGIGVMTGSQSDLRMGLPTQTVMCGEALNTSRCAHGHHRAPRERLSAIIERQPLLEKLFNNRWLLPSPASRPRPNITVMMAANGLSSRIWLNRWVKRQSRRPDQRH